MEIKVDDPRAVTALLPLLQKYGATDHTLLSSFHPAILQQLRPVAISASPDEVRLFVILSMLHLESCYSPPYQALQVPFEHKGTKILSQRLVDAAHARNVKVIPWTLNTEDEMRQALTLGVDGINSDRPSLLRKVLQNR